jgi:hypothetical protein
METDPAPESSPDSSSGRPRRDEVDDDGTSFDWAEFEAWEARPAEDGLPFWLLEE